MAFYNELQCNSLDAQSIHANDGITTPSINVGGTLLTALDFQGGITLPYLESNYQKKTDSTVLTDITANPSNTTFSKPIIAPSVTATGTISSPTMSSTMQNAGTNNVPNVGFLQQYYAAKGSSYLKSESDAVNASKLNTTDFNTYQGVVSTQLAQKSNVSNTYTSSQVDSLVSSKVDLSTFGSYQGSISTALSNKLNVGDVYTKAQQDAIVNGKVNISDNVAALATKVNTGDFVTYQNNVTNALTLKVNISDYNNAINSKISSSEFNTFVSATNTSLGQKANLTDLTQATTTLNQSISTKANVADVYDKSTVDGLVIARVLVGDYSAYKNSVQQTFDTKVDKTELTSYKSEVTGNLALKANNADVYVRSQLYTKTEADTLLAGKQANFANASTLSAINQNVATTSSPTFLNITSSNVPSTANHVTTKSYVDSAISSGVTAGTGLTKTGNSLAVNASQTQITTVGVLDGLAVTGLGIGISSAKLASTGNDLTLSANSDSAINLRNRQSAPLSLGEVSSSFNDFVVKSNTLADTPVFSVAKASGNITGAGSLSIAGTSALQSITANQITLANSGSNQPTLVLNNPGSTLGNTVSVHLNPNSSRTGGSSVILSGVDNGSNDAFFTVRVATGSTSTTASQIIKATSTAVQVSGSLSSTSLTSTGPVIGTTGIYSSNVSASGIGVNTIPNAAYPVHVLSPVAGNVSMIRLGMPNLGVPSEVSSSIVYGLDAFGVGDIASKISFIRLSSANNGRTALAFSTTAGGAGGTDYSLERLRIGSDGETSLYATIDSTSTTSGTLMVSGGAGIAKKLYVGGSLNLSTGVNITDITSGGTAMPLTFTKSRAGATCQVGDELGYFSWSGQTASSGVQRGAYLLSHTEAVTGSVISSNFIFNTTNAAGVAGTRLKISGEGLVSVSSTTDADPFNVSTTSPAVTLEGGFAVRRFSAFGNNVYVKGGVYPVSSDNIVRSAFTALGTGSNVIPSFLSFGTNTTGFFDFLDGNGGTKFLAIRPDTSSFSGKVAASNYGTATLDSATTQAGITFTKTVDSTHSAKTGRIVEIYWNFALSAVSGTSSGPVTVTLPAPCNGTFTMDSSTFWMTLNGAQVTNMRLSFTQNSAAVTILRNNGLGTFVNFTPGGTDVFHAIWSYPANSG